MISKQDTPFFTNDKSKGMPTMNDLKYVLLNRQKKIFELKIHQLKHSLKCNTVVTRYDWLIASDYFKFKMFGTVLSAIIWILFLFSGRHT